MPHPKGAAFLLCNGFVFNALDLRQCEADAASKMVRFEFTSVPPAAERHGR
jgi:hypothetical protein